MSRHERQPLVVLATDSLAPSGVGEHMLTLARTLAGTHRIVLAFRGDSEGSRFLERADALAVPTVALTSDDGAVVPFLRESGAALLHVHAGIGWEGHGLTQAGRLAGLPVVRTEHLPFVLTDAEQMEQHRGALDSVDLTIFVSQAAAASYRQAGQLGRRSATVANGVEPPEAMRPRLETRHVLGIADGERLVLTVARFTAQKGLDHLVAAAARVLAEQAHVRFVMVGDGPDRQATEALAARHGIAAQAAFLGARDDVPDLLAAADLFVLPSLFEGLPLVILEAMAVGLPIVTTRIGGTMEALGDDYPWMVEPGDDRALAAAILQALADPSRCAALGDANHTRFLSHFAAERMARQTADLYASVLSERVTAP